MTAPVFGSCVGTGNAHEDHTCTRVAGTRLCISALPVRDLDSGRRRRSRNVLFGSHRGFDGIAMPMVTPLWNWPFGSSKRGPTSSTIPGAHSTAFRAPRAAGDDVLHRRTASALAGGGTCMRRRRRGPQAKRFIGVSFRQRRWRSNQSAMMCRRSTRWIGSPVRLRSWVSRGNCTSSTGRLQDLQRFVLLQRLGDRGARVGVAVQQQQRRVHVCDVRERRLLPQRRVALQRAAPGVRRSGRAFEAARRGEVGRQRLGEQVAHDALRERGFEAVRVRDHPQRRVAAVAAAGDERARRVDVGALDDVVHHGRLVGEHRVAPVAVERARPVVAVADAAARVRVHDVVAARGEHLELVEEAVAELRVRAAVDVEHGRIALSGHRVGRLEHPVRHAAALRRSRPRAAPARATASASVSASFRCVSWREPRARRGRRSRRSASRRARCTRSSSRRG